MLGGIVSNLRTFFGEHRLHFGILGGRALDALNHLLTAERLDDIFFGLRQIDGLVGNLALGNDGILITVAVDSQCGAGCNRFRALRGNHHQLEAVGNVLNTVFNGNAIAYHYFSERYAREEASAKVAGRGIWQDINFTEPYFCRHFQAGHTCYEYDFASETGRVAELPLIGKSRAKGAPD